MSETAEKTGITRATVAQESCCYIRMVQRHDYIEISSGLKGADIILLEDGKIDDFISKLQTIKNQQLIKKQNGNKSINKG